MDVTKTKDRFGAIIYRNKNKQCHREDGPAVIFPEGDKLYYLNDKNFIKSDWEVEVAKLKLERIMDL